MKAKAKAMPCAKCGGSYKKGGVTRKKPMKKYQGTMGSSTVKSVDPNLAILSQAASTAAAIPASTNSAAANAAMVNNTPIPPAVPLTNKQQRQLIKGARLNNKLNRVKAKGSPETAELNDKKTDTNAKRLQNWGAALGLIGTGVGAFSGVKQLFKKEKTGGSTQYRRGGSTNKSAKVSPKSVPLSASKKAAVFKKGGTKKK